MKTPYQIDRCLQMYPSSLSEDSDLNDVYFDLIYLYHIPRSIMRNRIYYSLKISFTKNISTEIEDPLENNNEKKKIKEFGLIQKKKN